MLPPILALTLLLASASIPGALATTSSTVIDAAVTSEPARFMNRWTCVVVGNQGPRSEVFTARGFSRPDAAARARNRCAQAGFHEMECQLDHCRPGP